MCRYHQYTHVLVNDPTTGYGLALAANTAAVNRYAQLTGQQKQDILNKTHNVRSEKEMYSLVASLSNGIME